MDEWKERLKAEYKDAKGGGAMSNGQIKWESVMEYNDSFKDCPCSVDEPSFFLVIHTPDGKMYGCRFDGETDEDFRNRLKRSQADKHNYFLDEWKEYIPAPNIGVMY